MKYLPIPNQLFVDNRNRFIKQMKPNSIAVFTSNFIFPINADSYYKFKQNSNFFWLTGIEQENSMLILFPNYYDKKYQIILVLDRPQELKEKWDGKRLRKNEATLISGIDTIIWQENLEALLQVLIHTADNIYLDTNENDRKSTNVLTSEYHLIDNLKIKYPLHQYLRAAPILKILRSIKTKIEIDLINKAIDITHQTFLKILKSIYVGMPEYEIEAIIFHSFLSQRASKPAYNCIIASGDNARTLHYIDNNCVCKENELVLMDFGAEYANYCADLTRTIPVNGKFTKRQKELYDGCLNIHNYAKSLLKPYVKLYQYTDLVGEFASKTFLKLGLISKVDIKNESKENRAYSKYLYHGISHHLGIDVHDYGTKTEGLKPGMILTVEPGIYIEEEKVGIRLENNILITQNGNLDLMKNIPIKSSDIEDLMKK